MPWPPSSTRERTVASVGFLPLVILSFLNSPLRPGPIFFSSESALWHTAHCSKTALPLAASPLPAESITLEAAARITPAAMARNRYVIQFSLAQVCELTILQRWRVQWVCDREEGRPTPAPCDCAAPH